MKTASRLGIAYFYQNKLDQTEKMFTWALRGYNENLSLSNMNTLISFKNPSKVYGEKGKLDKAKRMYLITAQMMYGYHLTLGQELPQTPHGPAPFMMDTTTPEPIKGH